MRRFFVVTAFIALIAAPARAQQRLVIDIPGMADRAAETTDVTLDGSMLRFASRFLNDDDDRAARSIISKLQGIYVRSYEFDKEGEYDRSSVERLRSQLGPTWKRLVQVKSRSKENVEIYVDMKGDNAQGLLIISAEPKELTVVNLVGPIDVDNLSSLEGNFGIPHVTVTPSKGAGHE